MILDSIYFVQEFHVCPKGNFLEDYHNLTYKHAMGLRWASQFCPQAQMLIKIDDDTAANLPRLIQEIAPPLLNKENMLGAVFARAKPMRETSKWQVSLKEWPSPVYPSYLSG